MRMTRLLLMTTTVLAGTLGTRAAAHADTVPEPATYSASCMGSGSAFYGTFAPQQRAFVSQAVIDQAASGGTAPGSIYVVFATEKEGGSIPAPCGTRIE